MVSTKGFLTKFLLILSGLLGLGFFNCAGDQTPDLNRGDHSGSHLGDSIRFGDIVVYKSFVNQIRAAQGEEFDASLIVNSVYNIHRVMWDSCYGTIFGDNAPKFQTATGMVAWNKKLFAGGNREIDSLLAIINAYDIDSLFSNHVDRFATLGYQTPAARISLVFTPFPGIGFGGCANDQFILELNNPEFEIIYTLEKGLPHEIFHFINEENLSKEDDYTALDLAINEGLACHFTQEYFGGSVTKYEAVEGMDSLDWNYYLKYEKEIFAAVEPYFNDTDGDNPLLHPDRYGLFADAPRSLYYWLGYRIIEHYLEQHPASSIKELSYKPYAEIYAESNYKDKFSK